MPRQATVDELFDLAIAAEKAAEELYRRLAVRFTHHPEAADFWTKYAAEEAGHAEWLQRIRAHLSAEQLAAPADPRVLTDAHKALENSVETRLQTIGTLEAAYQLASELEHSETNAIFEFLITHYAVAVQAESFLRAQLKGHVGRLTNEFPARFPDVAARLAIKALEV